MRPTTSAPRSAWDAPHYWLRRYGPPELAAAAALAAAAVALDGASPLRLGAICAALEFAAFYSVAFLLHRRHLEGSARARRTALALVREYGPAELTDLALRPVLIAAAACLFPTGVAILVGSCVADAAFYATAAAAHRRAPARGASSAPTPAVSATAAPAGRTGGP